MSGEVAFGCEISEDRKHAAVVAAGREKDGTRIVVDLVWYDHPRGAVARLLELEGKHDPVATVVDPRSQAGTLIRPLAEAGVIVREPSTAEVVAAHGNFLDLVNDGRLAHLNQPPLTAAVQAAQQRPLAGAQAWERRITVDQSPLVAATLATWAFLRWEELSAPSVWAVLGGTVRLSAVLLVAALAGVLGGAWLIGRWALGAAIVFDSVVVGVLAVLLYDDGKPAEPQVHGAPTLHDVLKRANAS